MNVFVCNNNEETFQGRFDGVDYAFPKGKTVSIPLSAATHLFGYGQPDKKHALARWGILKVSSDLPKAMEWLGKFVFQEEEPAVVPDLAVKEEAPVQEEEPAE